MKRYLTLVLLLFTLVAAGCTPASPTNSQPQKQQTQTQQQQPGETKQGQDTKSQTDTKETPVANASMLVATASSSIVFTEKEASASFSSLEKASRSIFAPIRNNSAKAIQ